MLPTRADKKTRQLVRNAPTNLRPEYRAQKAANAFARFRRKKKVCEASGTKPCFLLFTEWVKETEYKGLIKIK